MSNRTKILIFCLSLVVLVTARCISEKSYALQLQTEKELQEGLALSKVAMISKLFGPMALGSTYYAMNPSYTCISNGTRIPSWEESIHLEKSGRILLKGDRCSKHETEIRELAVLSVIGDGNALAYKTRIYDRVTDIPKSDPGLNHQKFTEAFCTLDHQSMPNHHARINEDLHFHVYNTNASNAATFDLATGESPNDWKREIESNPVLSRSVTERVLLYQFNAEFSAYISLPGAVMNHSSLFTAYNSLHATGTGRGQCFLNPITLPPPRENTNPKIAFTSTLNASNN